jgi:GntR family transcriptional regulator, rspAB operon transcriptional repressor
MSEPRTATEQAYAGIVNLILTGNLRPGERTSVKLLAGRLGLGRTPVKEAITRLETEGVFSVAGRSGTTVKGIDAEEARQVFALRRMLEDFAAAEAVRNIEPSEIETLKALLRELKETSLGGGNGPASAARFVRANVAFHAAIVAAAHNPYLDRLYGQIQLQVQIVSYLLVRGENRDAARMRQKEHEAILEALESRDAELLRERLRTHSEVTEQEILSALDTSIADAATRYIVANVAASSSG